MALHSQCISALSAFSRNLGEPASKLLQVSRAIFGEDLGQSELCVSLGSSFSDESLDQAFHAEWNAYPHPNLDDDSPEVLIDTINHEWEHHVDVTRALDEQRNAMLHDDQLHAHLKGFRHTATDNKSVMPAWRAAISGVSKCI